MEYVSAYTTYKAYHPTTALRWNNGVLEQGWYCVDDGTTDWRIVPADNQPTAQEE